MAFARHLRNETPNGWWCRRFSIECLRDEEFEDSWYGANSYLSIIPLNVGSNTYNTALIVGEKAFLIIAEDLGIKAL